MARQICKERGTKKKLVRHLKKKICFDSSNFFLYTFIERTVLWLFSVNIYIYNEKYKIKQIIKKESSEGKSEI